MLFLGLFLLSITHKQGIFSLGIQTAFCKSDLLLSVKKDKSFLARESFDFSGVPAEINFTC